VLQRISGDSPGNAGREGSTKLKSKPHKTPAQSSAKSPHSNGFRMVASFSAVSIAMAKTTKPIMRNSLEEISRLPQQPKTAATKNTRKCPALCKRLIVNPSFSLNGNNESPTISKSHKAKKVLTL
jgi:hypothetical protein